MRDASQRRVEEAARAQPEGEERGHERGDLVPEISSKPVALAPRRQHQRRATHAHHPTRARLCARLCARAGLHCKIAHLKARGGAIAIAIAIAIASAECDHVLNAPRAGAFAQLDTRALRRAEQRLDDGAAVVGRREDAPVGLDL